MADYNTFVVVDCKKRKNVLVTSSAKKAADQLAKGFRIDLWNGNVHTRTIYARDKNWELKPYIEAEKEYHRQKQERRSKMKERRNG